MTATTRTCVIITCDVCQKPWSGDGPYHWGSLEEARGVAVEENWFIRTDGTAICYDMGDDHDTKGRELLAGKDGGLSDSERGDLFAVRRWLEPGYYDEEED